MLEATDLTCERGGRTLFRGLSFKLREGQALRVAGANGSGKSSLLRILCGLLPPDEGEVRWRGTPIRSLREDYSAQLVYLGHAPAVKDELTAHENLMVACRVAGRGVPHDEAARALAAFGIAANAAPVRRLSQGQRRRAALARLELSAARPLWLLDEPFSALDRQGIDLIVALMGRHLARGGAIVLATHEDPGIAAARTVELGNAR